MRSVFFGGNPYENINAALSRLGFSTGQGPGYESKFGITVTNAPAAIAGSAPHQLAAAPGTPAPVSNAQPTQPSTEENIMLTPLLSAVMGAALGVAPSPTTSLPASSTTPHVLGECIAELVLPSGENYGRDISPVDAALRYLDAYTSIAFQKAIGTYETTTDSKKVDVRILESPQNGKLLDQGDPASGEWYRQGAEGGHLYRYVPDKGHETDSDRFTVRVTLNSVQIDIQYRMEAVPFEDRPDEYCPHGEWKISQITVFGSDGTQLASITFTPENPFRPLSPTSDPSGIALALSNLHVTFGDLAGPGVGQESADGTIALDTEAAGYGWFIDPTPNQNEEFLPTSNPNEWIARPGSAADGKMDMQSVLPHEYGHAMGLNHSPDSHDFMATTLAPSVRALCRPPT